MNLTVRKNGGFPSLLADFFDPSSLLSRDFFDLDEDLYPSRLGINVPTANVTETPKEYKIDLAAPGLERKDFKIEIDNHILKISAEKEEEKNKNDGEYSRREYSFDSFHRYFNLPENVKEEIIEAKYENGVLKVTVPKLKEAPVKSPRNIVVS